MKRLKAKTNLLAGVALVSALSAGIAWAVHDVGVFELDGNAILTGISPPDDWIQIYCDHIDLTRTGVCAPASANPVLAGTPVSNALVSTFLTDPVNSSSDDIFDGAKDTLDISFNKWSWKSFSSNDKNDIEHGYAALYESGGIFYLYFGMDKLSNNGDAAIGFWFLQNEVTQVGNIGGNSALDFSPNNAHVNGDVLVQADITKGGDVPRFDVYTWGANSLLNESVLLAQGDLYRAIHGSECGLAAGDSTCAIMNTVANSLPDGSVTAPWPYQFKFSGGVADSTFFPTATLFEAGLNLNVIFPGGIPCV